MPVQPRAGDTFTRDNLLLGFSQIEFTPTGSATPVPLGILSSQALQKVVETLQLPKGDSGTITIDREIVSRIEPSFVVETFNLRSDVARYIFGSDVVTAVTADAAAAQSDDVTIPGSDPFDRFVSLSRGDIDESTVEVTCQTITAEDVGTGDGVANDFVLDYKVKAVADVTSVTVGGVAYTPVGVGAAAAGNEVEVVIGEVDGGHPTTSGSLEFFVGGVSTPPPNGDAIVATYTPSFSTTGTDIVNLTDFVFDPVLGNIRFLDPAGADNSPFRTTGDQQPLTVAYDYDRKSHVVFQPFRQNSFDGSAVIRHLPDIGVNFIWTVPSATIRVTDDELTFGVDDLATGTLQLNINDAGGTNRFGTIEYSSEPEAAA